MSVLRVHPPFWISPLGPSILSSYWPAKNKFHGFANIIKSISNGPSMAIEMKMGHCQQGCHCESPTHPSLPCIVIDGVINISNTKNLNVSSENTQNGAIALNCRDSHEELTTIESNAARRRHLTKIEWKRQCTTNENQARIEMDPSMSWINVKSMSMAALRIGCQTKSVLSV